jgi:cadmium resistance protein CadD (predicted permease)
MIPLDAQVCHSTRAGRTVVETYQRLAPVGDRQQMNETVTIIAASATTLAATNLDDIFLLTVLFARRLPTRRIVTGQYVGFAAIILVSCAVVWGVGAIIPRTWLRLLGILPLVIGLKELLQNHKLRQNAGEVRTLSVFSIAAVTLANGADNIGVYAPFFLISKTRLWLVLTVYGVLVFVWCLGGKWLGSHKLVLNSLDRWGRWIVPCVLIGLGTYILLFM